jgi:hypothetical protein
MSCNDASKKPAEIRYVWHKKDLDKYQQVDWDFKSPIPLSPEKAVYASLEYLENEYGKDIAWKIQSIEIKPHWDSVWMYTIQFQCEINNEVHFEFVRVLFSGDVWKQVPQGK